MPAGGKAGPGSAADGTAGMGTTFIDPAAPGER